MEEDSFFIVSKKKGKLFHKEQKTVSNVRAEGTKEDIEKALWKARQNVLESNLHCWIILRLEEILSSRPLSRILLIGNGHFDAPWEPGAHQLALVQLLKEHYLCNVLFQEPCISGCERDWVLSSSGYSLRTDVDLLIDHSECGVELVVFIHGLHFLMNDLLWRNWSENKLMNTIFLCNDYCNIGLIGGTQHINSEFEALNTYRTLCKSIVLPNYSSHPSFFHETSILYWNCGNCPVISKEKPKYSNLVG